MGKGEGASQQAYAPRVNWMASTLLVFMMLVVTPLTAVAEAQPNPQPVYAVDLPPQTIAESLNQLARQTGAQFLFPFHLAHSKAARPVKGRYTLLQAMQHLLHNTGLQGDLVDGVLTISQVPCEPTESDCDPNNLYGYHSEKGKSMNIKNSTTRKTLLAGLVGLFAAGGATQVAAQGGEVATEQSRIDEIIVTAQKREQSLQDTALAITALTGEGLKVRGIDSGYDLQFSVPSLTTGPAALGAAQVTLRGVGMDNAEIAGDPGVPIHIDGHYIQDTAYIFQDFMDIERVEVLRGPQGTLYGRNAIGGSINIITKRPTDELEAYVGIGLGNYDKRAVQVSVSGPLTDGLRGRFAMSDENRDGYIENISSLGGDDYKDSDYTSLRGTLEYDVTDNVLVTLSGYYFEDKGNNLVVQHFAENPTSAVPGFLNYFEENNALPNPSVSDPRKIRTNIGDDAFKRTKGASIDIDWDLGNVLLRSLSTYNSSNYSFLNDNDASDAVTAGHTDPFKNSFDTFSQEFQLLSGEDSKSTWILGLFYYDESSDNDLTSLGENWFAVGGPPTNVFVLTDRDSSALGIFGQVEYPLTDRLALVGGLRYNKDKKTDFAALSIPSFALEITTDGTEQWEEITGKIGLNYHVDDEMLLYFSYSTGYKAGGFNLISTETFAPETVKAYEAGLKSAWFDKTLQTDFSAFYYDYTDKQELRRDSVLVGPVITNADSVPIWGVEIEGTARPSSALTIDMSISYLNAEYDEFSNVDDINLQLGLQDLSGNRLPRAPEWKVKLGLQYDWVLDLGRIFARIDSVWVDEQFSSAFNRPDRDFMDSYNRTNAQLNWESHDDLWQASLYVQNLEDDDVISNRTDGDPNYQPVPIHVHYFSPRTYGLQVTRHF
jgi:iron complex outermembrane receptor protein